MNISKLTILPHSPATKKIVLQKPCKNILHSELTRVANLNTASIPKRLVKKVMKEHNVPSYINNECYIAPNALKAREDSRVLGGKIVEFFG